ncbi:MAG: glutamate racemase [Candidatus Pacebacteria bacterium]|nr:glutamate racemase [Candidatus Paceibacterota bacterium]
MIGVFDSGVGGLTVVKEIFRYLPEYQIIYFGDTARLPYGTKGEAFVKRYSAKITEYLIKRGAKIIVIACHTSSSWASESLKKQFSIPVFEMITSAGLEASLKTKNNKIGIIGTPGTIKSRSFEKKLLKINPDLKIYPKSCPLFVPLVEEGWVSNRIVLETAKEYLSGVKSKRIDTLILACTHYPLLEGTVKKIMGPKVSIINPAKTVAKEIRDFLENNPKTADNVKKGANHQFFFSDEPYNFKKISHLCFNRKMKIKVKDPF